MGPTWGMLSVGQEEVADGDVAGLDGRSRGYRGSWLLSLGQPAIADWGDDEFVGHAAGGLCGEVVHGVADVFLSDEGVGWHCPAVMLRGLG